MDISIINDYITPIAVVAALCIGYIVRNLITTDSVNKYIPLIVAAVGIAVTCAVDIPAGAFSVSTIVNGMVSGLASTGLYEAFSQLMTAHKVSALEAEGNADRKGEEDEEAEC